MRGEDDLAADADGGDQDNESRADEQHDSRGGEELPYGNGEADCPHSGRLLTRTRPSTRMSPAPSVTSAIRITPVAAP